VVNGGRRTQDLVKVGAVVLLIAVLALGLFLEQSNINAWLRMFGAVIDAVFAVVGGQLLAYGPVPLDKIVKVPVDIWHALVKRRGRSMTVAAVVVAIGVPLAVVMAWPATPRLVATGCPEPLELRVLTSTDGQAWVGILLDQYTRSTAKNADAGSGRCPTVHPVVYSAPRPQAAQAMAASWATNGTQDPLRDIGPRPDIWLPDSQLDVADVMTQAPANWYAPPVPNAPVAVTSIGFSPIVVAGRNSSTSAAVSALTSSQALASVFGPGSGVLAADPDTSTTGLLAMVDYLRNGTGTVTSALAHQRVQAVTGSAGAAGSDSVTALCQAGNSRSTASAVITSDQLWQLYSTDNGLRNTCPDGAPDFTTWSRAAAETDAPVLDHPLVEPTWTWGNVAVRDRVQDLRNWLRSGDGVSALSQVHLQPAARCQTTPLPFVGCGPADLKPFRTLYNAAKSPGRVLFVMDESGSMESPVPSGGSRFGVARAGLVQSLGLIGYQDQFGLWAFPGPKSQDHVALLSDIDVLTPKRRDDAVAALAHPNLGGDTPLYSNIVDGIKAVTSNGAAGHKTALVVLTDGQDTGHGKSRENAQAQIDAATGTEVYIVAIGEAACHGPRGLGALTAGHGDCYDTSYNEISNTMARLFESLWKG
jgi:hypothetical protein